MTPRAPLASADDIEQAFYDALQRGDVERVMAIWSDEDEIACVHPGGPRLIGAAAIRASFEAILGAGGLQARVHRLRRLELPGAAVHHVVEEVSGMTEEGPRTAYVVATNAYVKGPHGWRMVLHHASTAIGEDGLQEVGEAPSVLH